MAFLVLSWGFKEVLSTSMSFHSHKIKRSFLSNTG
jgi:hypothetical protein